MHLQTNVLASAQRRKMKGYGDFKRITAVIIPDDAIYKERCEKQTEKTVSDNALNEMKGKFYISIKSALGEKAIEQMINKKRERKKNH